MSIEFKEINLKEHFDICLQSRKDAYFCSFNTFEGFSDFILEYKERVEQRLEQQEWFYIHVWSGDDIIGQLEFRSFSSEPDTGYIHLIYLKPEFRGKGIAGKLQFFIQDKLIQAGCKRAVLSVSRINERALKHYKHFGWEYRRSNPKNALTDFYQIKLFT